MATNEDVAGSESCPEVECNPCSVHTLVVEAKSYCLICSEHLCERCLKTHNGIRLTRDHKLVPVSGLKELIYKWKPNPKSGPHLSSSSRRINSCTFLPNGNLVVVDCANSSLLVYDKTFASKTLIKIRNAFLWDIAAESDQVVYVTEPMQKTVQKVGMSQRAVLGTFEMKRKCYGIALHAGLLYITQHDDPGKGEIIVVTTEGETIRKIGRNDDRTYRFISPFFIRVSPSGPRMYVSDANAATLTCMSLQGHVIYTVSDNNLIRPRGLSVTDNDEVIVCGADSDNVMYVSYDGTKRMPLIDCGSLVSTYPRCLCYRGDDRTLVVTFKNAPDTVSFNF